MPTFKAEALCPVSNVQLLKYHLIGASPTLARSLVRLSRIQTTARKSKQFPYLVGNVVCVVDNNELSLVMLHIWLVGSFVLRRMTN